MKAKIKKKIKTILRKSVICFVALSTILSMTSVPYLAPMKIKTVQAAAPTAGQVVISEIKVQGADATEQFVELYNKTATAYDLADCGIYTAPADSVAVLTVAGNWPTAAVTINASNHRNIPGYGYFLFAPVTYQPYGMIADIEKPVGGTPGLDLGTEGGFVALICGISTTPVLIDQVGYGEVTTTASCKQGGCAPAPSLGSIERKAQADSNADTMLWGGDHEYLGNGYDDGPDDSNDFVSRSQYQDDPQRSTSPMECSNFMIMDIMPMGPTTVEVMFNKQIDPLTVNTNIAVLSTADTTDNETITAIYVKDGHRLEIHADGANINSSTGNDTITVSGNLTDINDNNNTSTGAQVIQMFMPPEIMGVRSIDNDTIKIYFSKAMEEASSENKDAYGFFVNGSAVSETDMTLSLDTNLNSTILTVSKTGAFANLSNAGNDYVEVDYDPSVAPKDLEGSPLMPSFGWQREFPIDGTAPRINSGTFSATDKTVTLYFSEELMSMPGCAAEQTSNYEFGGATGACSGTKSVRFQENTNGPSYFDTIVINCSGGVTLNNSDTVTVSTNVTDKAGNPMDTSSNGNVFTVSASANEPIRILSVSGDPSKGSWYMPMDGCADDYGETGNTCAENVATNRDSLTITFDGSINPNSINYDSTNNISYNIGSYLEVYERHTRTVSASTDCQSWEYYQEVGENKYCVDKMIGGLGNSFGVLGNADLNDDGDTLDTGETNNKLTIYLQGWDTNVMFGMEVNPTGITGMNGLTAQQSATPENNRFTMNFADVDFVKADKSLGNDSNAFDQNDTVTLFFSGDMNRNDIVDFSNVITKLIPSQHMPYWQEHSWGIDGSVDWGNHDGVVCTTGGTNSDETPDCLKITLGNNTTVADKDEIMVNNVTDANGLHLGWGGMIDTTVLAVSNYIWNGTDNILTLEFNKMLSDYNATGSPPTPDFSDNTITFTDNNTGGVVLSSAEPTFDMVGGMGGPCDMFKKIKLTLSGAIEAGDTFDFSSSEIGDENGNLVPNINVVASNPSGNQVTPVGDDVKPVLAKVIANDWNADGILNGGDEIIFKFDNDSDTSNGLTCDVDYSTLSNINDEFIVKRNSQAVQNAFGEWVNFWVDMWEEYAGELHINLGPGADIQADDEIWATGTTLADYAGNKLDDSASLATIKESRGAEISKVVYANVDASVDEEGDPTATDTDTFVIHFSQAIDPYTLGAYTQDGSPEVTNIDWGLGIEFNWEAGYGSTYDASTFKTWGGATGNWDSTFKELTITLAGGNAVIADFDMVVPYGIQSVDGAWVNKPGFIDMTRPALEEVILVDDSDSDGNVDPGDKIVLIFSEEMYESTITGNNLTISPSGNLGASPTINFPAPGICEITLDTDATEIPSGATFDPKDAVTDLAGLPDNTSSPVVIQAVSVKPVSNVILSDNDSTYPGIDGRDIDVTWTAPNGAEATYTYDIYLLPDFVPFNPDSDGVYTSGENTHFPIAHLNHSDVCSGTACSYVGIAGLMNDSRTAVNTSTGLHNTTCPFFPISDWEMYTVYVVAIDGDSNRSFPQRYPTAIYLTMEYGGAMDNQAPWVEGTQPFDGAIVPINTTKMGIKFSEPMSRTSIETAGAIKLQTCSSDCSNESNWSNVSGVYVSYNADHNKAEISLANNLTANAKYRFDIPSPGVEDMSGFAYTGRPSYFRASSESDTTPPKVMGNSFQFEGIGATSGNNITEVPRTEPMLGIAFDKDMDHSTFTTDSVKLTPTVPGSDFHYDPMMMGMAYFFGSPLAQDTTYTLTLSGVYVKDIAGNTLDGNEDGTAAGTTSDNYTLTFTTLNEVIDTITAPTINWIGSDGHHIDVGFSADMKTSSATNKSNWILTNTSSGAVVNTQMSNFDYDPFMKELHIGPIELNPGTQYTFTPNGSVMGMNGVAINTNNSLLNFTPQSWDVQYSEGEFGEDMYQTGGMFGDGGMFHDDMYHNGGGTGYNDMMKTGAGGADHMGAFDPAMAGKMYMDNAYMDQDVMTFMPINAWPMNQIEGQTTNYHIGFPTTKAIPHGGKIVLKFPTGFDLSSAAMAVDDFMGDNQLFFFNQDINGPGGIINENEEFNPEGKVQISGITVNNMDKTIALMVAVQDSAGCALNNDGTFKDACTNSSVHASTETRASTMPFDYIDFELSGIKNGSASEIDWQTNTGGYQIQITVKDNTGKVLEGGSEKPIKSMKFPIKSAGAGGISGKVTGQDGVTAVPNAMVFIDSPMSGPIDAKTGADGTYSVSGLPVVAGSENAYEGWYHIHIESPKNNETYFGGADFDVQLTQSNPTASGKNVKLASADNTLTVTLETTLVNEDLMIWVGGSNGHNEKKVSLDANTATNDQFTIKVADGGWDVGVHPFFAEAMFTTGPPPPPSFMPPPPKFINVSGDTNVSLSLTSSNYEITGMVRDGVGGNGLSNVHVHAFSPYGGGFPVDTETRTDGSFTLKVSPGIYQIEGNKPGLPPTPLKTIEVKDISVTGVEIIMRKPETTISGKVTDGTNGIRYAGVNAWDNYGRFASTDTNENGEYILYVDSSNSWSIEVFAPGYGKINPASGVVATGIDTTSGNVPGINFSPADSNIVTISGTVKDASGNAVSGVEIWTDQISWSGGTEGYMTGVGNFTKTDANGSYTLKVPASTAGIGSDATRYRIGGWYPDSGDLTPITGFEATSNVTGKNFTLPTSRTITIDIQNAPSDNLLNSDHADYIGEAFVDVYSDSAGKGNGKMISDTDLSDTSDGTIKVPEGSGYRAHLHIPGYGEFRATENGTNGFSVSGANKTIHFDLKRAGAVIIPIAISGTVKDASANAIENAWVSVINEDTYETIGVQTANDGSYSVKIPNYNYDDSVASYKVRVDKPGYNSPAAIEGVTADNTTANFIMLQNTSTIAGTIYSDAAKTMPVADAVVMAKEVGGDGFIKTITDSQGTFSLDVAPDEAWNLIGKSVTGNKGQKMNIGSGSSNIDVVLTDQIKTAEQGQLATTPKIQSMTPSEGGVFNDVDNTGVKMTIPSRALGDSSASGQIQTRETASVPETTDYKPLGGIGKEITAVDSDGSPITRMSSDIDIEFVFKKDKIEAMTETDSNSNNLAQLDQMKNVYWDETANNYVTLSTVKTVQTKAENGSDWTPTDWNAFLTAVNSDKDNYDDYKVTLKSKTDHFTIFGVITGSDSTAPGAPTGLTATAGVGQVSLNWADNSEADLMEYQVYRSASASVQAINANQINTSQVSASQYTDTDVANETKYYYAVTAADNSGNESSVSNEVSATPTTVSGGTNPAASTATVSTTTGTVEATASKGGSTTLTTSENTTAKVEIPANALTENATIEIASASTATVFASAPAPTGKSMVSAFTISAAAGTAAITSFSKSITLTFTYTNAQISGINESTLTIYRWNGTEWVALTSTVDSATNTIIATTTEFSNFAIMGDPIVELVDGDVARIGSAEEVYVIKLVGSNKYKRHIVSPMVFNSYGHLSWDAIKSVSSLDDYSLSAWVRVCTGANGAPAATDKVYEVNADSTMHWLNMTAAQFYARGGSDEAIYNVNDGELGLYTLGVDVLYE
jgi:hypothetical protein